MANPKPPPKPAAKKEVTAAEKTIRNNEASLHRVRDQLSCARFNVEECIKVKKNLQDELKALTKTLAMTERERSAAKKELEKAMQCKEVKKAEAAQAALKKEEVILKREKVRCENRLRSMVVEMELDRAKKESLLVTQANLKQDFEAAKDSCSRGKRDHRIETAEDCILSSMRAVGRTNAGQGGHFPPLNSPEASQLVPYQQPPSAQMQPVQTPQRPVVTYQTPMGHLGATPTPQAIGGTTPEAMANIVAAVVSTMHSRGSQFTQDDLPKGVEMVCDQLTGRVLYKTPQGPDGICRYYENRDDLFQKAPSTPRTNDARAFGLDLSNLFVGPDRRVRPRVSPPIIPNKSVSAIPPAAASAVQEEKTGDSQSLVTQPDKPTQHGQ